MMSTYEIVLLLMDSIVSAGIAAWVIHNHHLSKQKNAPVLAPSLPVTVVASYLRAIENFVTDITPIWTLHIEASRQQMEAEISALIRTHAGGVADFNPFSTDDMLKNLTKTYTLESEHQVHGSSSRAASKENTEITFLGIRYVKNNFNR
jgi:hypothetical protein